MAERANWKELAPEAYQAQVKLEIYVRNSGLDRGLLELVKLRASQINHCAYCIDMHWRELRSHGESESRLYGLEAWRESPNYTPRERAALEWTEAVTLLTEGFVPEEVYARVQAEFAPEELVKLTMAVVAINGWNRLCVAFRTVPGSLRPETRPQ